MGVSVASSFNRIYNYVVLANGSSSFSIGLTLFSFNYPILAVYAYTSGTPSGYVLVTIQPGDEVSVHNNPTFYYMIDYYSGARHIPLTPYEYVNVSINVSKGGNLLFDAYLYDWLGEVPWTT